MDQEANVHAVLFTQLDDAVENRLPILVTREIVVGDKKTIDALLVIRAQDALDVVRAPPAAIYDPER